MKALEWHRQAWAQLIAAKATLPHALLLRGPRGIGKLAFAQALAQALLCESPGPDGDACEACVACTWFASGTHPDYRLVEPESESETTDEEGEEEAEPATSKSRKKPSLYILIPQIRALADFINITSHRGGPKVIVIHPAEMLYPNSAHALLKSLEEPPPRTHFILVTHRPQQLLPTVTSRCSAIALPAPETDAAIAWLRAQGVRQPELALAHTGNAPLLALELNDTEYWGARAAFLRQLSVPDIDVIAAADAVSGYPVPHVMAWMQKWSYDLASQRTVGAIRYNPDQHEAIARAASRVDGLAALRFHREMVKLQRDVSHPLNPRLFVEHLLLAYRDLMQPQVT